LFVTALLGIAVLVAFTGWWGVADHHVPWSLVDGGLWRAASTLTYSNATAAFLVPVALMALARLIVSRHLRPNHRWSSMGWSALTTVLLIATGATLSRAGFLALAIGWAILAWACGPKVTARATLGPAIGAVIGLAGLIPSMPAAASVHPGPAALAMLAGVIVAMALTREEAPAAERLRGRHTEVVVVGFLVLAGLLALSAPNGLGAIRTSRVNTSSPDRTHEWSATWTLARNHPVVGVGPGPFAATWIASDGTTMTAEYTHNEYLQLTAQQGAVGVLAMLVASLLLLAALLWRRPRPRSNVVRRAAWAGPAAGLAALAVHSGFDFLWHIPLLVVLGAVLAGAALPIRPSLVKELS
jgi:hypothetical protein